MISAVYSSKADAGDAVVEITEKLAGNEISALVFFASSNYDPYLLNSKLRSAFPTQSLIGCQTAGELVTGHMLKSSLVALALTSNEVEDLAVGVVENLADQSDLSSAVKTVLSKFSEHFGAPIAGLDTTKYVGLTLIDGLSGSEEKLMDLIGNETDLLFVGGSAGDDLKFTKTLVFADGKVYENAAVLALLKPRNGFEIVKTQSFDVTDKILRPTKVDAATRTVYEFDGRPAVEAYAAAVGCTPADLPEHFGRHPLGLVVDGEPFVRSPQQIVGSAVKFYCGVQEGMPLSVLEARDIVADTKAALDQADALDSTKTAGILNFHCILRTLELEHTGRTQEYGSLFSGLATVGFSTYGEQYLGHINQTSTILVLR